MLLEHILPLLPPERHRELRLVATAMAIAEREAEAGDAPAREIAGLLPETFTDRRRPARSEDAARDAGDSRRRPAAPLRRRPARRRIRPMQIARAQSRVRYCGGLRY